jgi:nitroreductase
LGIVSLPTDRHAARMSKNAKSDDVSLEELEEALKVAAYAVWRFGAVYAPIMVRLEKLVEEARRGDPREHARRILEGYTAEGGRKAMRPSHSALLSKE